MAFLMFNPGIKELMTNAGTVHRVPDEVIEQAENHEELEFAARWAYKANLIDRAELSEAMVQSA